LDLPVEFASCDLSWAGEVVLSALPKLADNSE
jgi:hypothetical protein